VFDKLKFWKRKEPELPPIAPPSAGPGPLEGPSMGELPAFEPSPLGMEAPATPQLGLPTEKPILGVTPKPEVADKEMQLVNAKLDAIKAVVDNINQRLDSMEKPQEKEVIQWR